MNNFFANIYSWFWDNSQSVFQFMNVIADEEGTVVLQGYFNFPGVWAVVISGLIAVAFYIWPINHPRFKAWWAWLTMAFLNALINFGLAFLFLYNRISDIEQKTEALEILEIDGENIELLTTQYLNFAWANIAVCTIFFIVWSLILNWFSVNCRFSPFRN